VLSGTQYDVQTKIVFIYQKTRSER
jgi:hypothetical protein